MAQTLTERIAKTPGVCGGKACLTGHRIRVMDIAIWHERMGMSPDEIVQRYPTITLSDVHAALSYYYDHLEEIREDIRSEEEYADEFQRTHPSVLELNLKKQDEDAA